jgi:hypothetical protein
MKHLVVFLLGIFTATNGLAETIQVDYKRFYSHVSKLGDEDTKALQFAFGFIRVGEGRLCEITQAQIVTPKQTLPLDVSPEYRFTVPKDKILKMAEAMVEVTFVEAANLCDMSVQLETKAEYLKTHYSADDLKFLHEQYEAFFNEMGGFLSFMMPSVQGLMIHFSNKFLDTSLADAPAITNGMLLLDDHWLEQHKDLTLPEVPLRITALAKSN